MNILFVTRWSPRRDGGGTEQRAAMHLRTLLRIGRVHLLYAGDGDPSLGREDAERLQSIVTLFSVRSSRVATDLEPINAGLWQRLAVGAWGLSGWLSAPNAHEVEAVRRVLVAHKFDMVFAFHIGSALIADAVLGDQPTVVRALDWDFIESPNIIRWAARGDDSIGLFRRCSAEFNAWKLRRLEERVMSRWPFQLCSSQLDIPILESRAPSAKVLAVDNPCVVPEAPTAIEPGADPAALFVGTMAYWPNQLAAEHLVTEIWPRVRRSLPSAQLCIVGRAVPVSLKRYDGADGVQIHSNVPSLEPYYRRSQVALAPLHHVVGSNLKIPEAMAHGRPVVGYKMACARAGVGSGDGVYAVSSPEQFSEQLVALLSDRMAADGAGQAAFRTASRRFQSEILEERLARFLRHASDSWRS